jgi:histidinol dehydrogenase
VYDFLTRTSLIEYSPASLREQAKFIENLARLEGLEAHARAVGIRIR